MNDRWGEPLPDAGRHGYGEVPTCVPLVPHMTGTVPAINPEHLTDPKKPNHRHTARREHSIARDSLLSVWRDNTCHIISEDYSYKTEPYYAILQHELDGIPVRPASADVLDAYVVPICLERAHLAGIPVCEWGISQGYTPLPSIVYGLNYFATSSDYSVVSDDENAKEVIRHITNKGKYPFCYQKLDDGAEIESCRAIFGKTAPGCRGPVKIAQRVYDLFGIPLVTMVYVKYGTRSFLSSLAPTRYSKLTAEERSLLSTYISPEGAGETP